MQERTAAPGHGSAGRRSAVSSEISCSNPTGIQTGERRRVVSRAFLVLAAMLVLSACANAADVHESTDVENADCVTCHRDDYEEADNPVHVQQLPLECDTCHNTEVWEGAFGANHDAFYPLELTHAQTGCGECHTVGFESGQTPTECIGCHADDYARAVRPPHATLPQACALCHVPDKFSPAVNFNHGALTGFDLQGEHSRTQCVDCHGDPPQYGGTDPTCVACHAADQANANPPHEGWDGCTGCHNFESFNPSFFDHNAFTRFALAGAHAEAACTQCHGSNPAVYAGTSTDCYECHQDDSRLADAVVLEPNHSLFPLTCGGAGGCHNPEVPFRSSSL